VRLLWPKRALGVTAVLATALPLLGCGDASSPKPPPDTIETAKAASRPASIEAPFSATPEKGGNPQGAITLDARVFGSGATGVILAHMRPADQTAWFPFATKLAGTGQFTVLTFDFRGFGASTGDKAFDQLDTDLAAAYDYMRNTLKLDRIFLVGASMGGTASLVLGARKTVAGVVSISSPAQFETLDALAAEPEIVVPQLFVTSEDDVPAQRSQEELVEAAGRPVDQQVYDGNAHGTDLPEGPHAAELEQRLIDFLTAN
jgi:pimeloyl-ACP methyl ester carboxylesterase